MQGPREPATPQRRPASLTPHDAARKATGVEAVPALAAFLQWWSCLQLSAQVWCLQGGEEHAGARLPQQQMARCGLRGKTSSHALLLQDTSEAQSRSRAPACCIITWQLPCPACTICRRLQDLSASGGCAAGRRSKTRRAVGASACAAAVLTGGRRGCAPSLGPNDGVLSQAGRLTKTRPRKNTSCEVAHPAGCAPTAAALRGRPRQRPPGAAKPQPPAVAPMVLCHLRTSRCVRRIPRRCRQITAAKRAAAPDPGRGLRPRRPPTAPEHLCAHLEVTGGPKG